MANAPKKVENRITQSLKRFQPILAAAKNRDINESDTVTILVDMLAEMFGYDRYEEITKEYEIKGTYCDLATKVDGRVCMLIEAKAIGIDLNERHLKQASDYAANKGIEWVALTNGITWQIYNMIFAQPISKEKVLEFNLLEMNPKATDQMNELFLVAREGIVKSALAEYHDQRQAANCHKLGALLLSDPILSALRRELKKVSPNVRIQNEEIKAVLVEEVIKGSILEGDLAKEASTKIAKALKKDKKRRAKKQAKAATPPPEDPAGSDGGGEEEAPLLLNP